MSKLRFNERIGYNFASKEIAKGIFEKILKENKTEIEDVFVKFAEITVEIRGLDIVVFDKFGYVNELKFNDIDTDLISATNIKVNLEELLLNFVADTYLKLNNNRL